MDFKRALLSKTKPAIAKSILGFLLPDPITKAAAEGMIDLR